MAGKLEGELPEDFYPNSEHTVASGDCDGKSDPLAEALFQEQLRNKNILNLPRKTRPPVVSSIRRN